MTFDPKPCIYSSIDVFISLKFVSNLAKLIDFGFETSLDFLLNRIPHYLWCLVLEQFIHHQNPVTNFHML